MELKMLPYTIPEKVEFNFSELKAELTRKAETYANMVYTEEQMAVAKTDRANLNRLKKALNDERIRREREYMQPFSKFKDQIAEIIAIIDKPVQAIDKQVKEYEEKRREEKRAAIYEIWMQEDAPDWLRIIKDKWLNATTSLKSIADEIKDMIAQAEKDLEMIRALGEYAFEAEEAYKETLDLAEALKCANRLKYMAGKKAETERLMVSAEGLGNANYSAETEREWLTFKANVTTGEARAIGDHMRRLGVQFEVI